MSNKPHKILVVDDEVDILEILKYNLEKEEYIIKVAKDGKKALEVVKNFIPDLVILDIMMPVMDGVETCRRLRDMKSLQNTYIIFLTARGEEYSEIAAFEVGTNDYITKPIRPRALMTRINAYFKREDNKSFIPAKNIIQIGNMIIDKGSYTLIIGDKKSTLPKKEFELLFFLAQSPNKVFSRDELLQHIWGTDVYVLPRTVDVHITRVRDKIGKDYIKTVKGVGYKFLIE